MILNIDFVHLFHANILCGIVYVMLIFYSSLCPIQYKILIKCVFKHLFHANILCDILQVVFLFCRKWSEATFKYMIDLAHSQLAKHVGASIVSGYQLWYNKEAGLYLLSLNFFFVYIYQLRLLSPPPLTSTPPPPIWL